MTFRAVIFWPHLAAGVLAGSVILIMSVTGVLLTYEKQMLTWVDRSARLELAGARSGSPWKRTIRIAIARPPDSKHFPLPSHRRGPGPRRADVAGLVSLGASVLVWTGLALAYRRFFVRSRANNRRARRCIGEIQ